MAKTKTVTERLRDGLVAMGYTQEESRSSKYEKWVKRGHETNWLGKSAGLRIGQSPSNSFGALDAYKDILLKAGEAAAQL